MAEKTWGKTVLGWFVVQDEQQRSSDDEIIANAAASAGDDYSGQAGPASYDEAATPSLDPAQVFKKDLPAVKGGAVDFPAVFEAAGIDAEEQSRIAKASELLRSLPADTDLTVKKQIVQASLKAFGVPIEKIIESGVEEIQALEGYIRAGAADTQKVADESERRIKQYEEEIKQLRLVMQQRVAEQQLVMKSCNEKKLEIQQILEFFGREAVERVVKASPKLVDPSAPQTTEGR